jgi:hypothetical protein
MRKAFPEKIVAEGVDTASRAEAGNLRYDHYLPFIVCELLRRMQGKAAFATVSGRINNPARPMALYHACGFTDPVIWHVITIQCEDER